ncbi:hypothetical protein Pgy4_11937 [Pseudomonas savastanoi pv. glycinea str. race 4]|uniref:Uncharacterized protein n=1 Tax=Pseudomonas savastanoi pv. glycinea str. race 4 TaxID=875330 RepID=E7PLL0_PSESG|nr:hypothetical protein PsgRace4_12768 [Pseudomonas savastanoi pv. glycinea str. race 4]EGH12135.1 hypothetical protein Pgy4_11937 [Pseudomonas savastanoi pv. glycinea str. race 4]
MQGDGHDGDAQANQNCRLACDAGQRNKQGQRLYYYRNDKQGTDQILQIMTWASIPVRDYRSEYQVKQPEKCQADGVRVLQVERDRFTTQARYEREQQGCCSRYQMDDFQHFKKLTCKKDYKK